MLQQGTLWVHVFWDTEECIYLTQKYKNNTFVHSKKATPPPFHCYPSFSSFSACSHHKSHFSFFRAKHDMDDCLGKEKHRWLSIDLLTAETATADLVLLSHGMAAADYASSQGYQGNEAPSVLY